MKKITFYRWLNFQRKRDDRVGDLARDAYESSWGEESLKNLKNVWTSHLHEHGACMNAILTVDIAWKAISR